ncbi:hypothetical protein U1Q18_032638 [Sarracenia purpurea var. burkii]
MPRSLISRIGPLAVSEELGCEALNHEYGVREKQVEEKPKIKGSEVDLSVPPPPPPPPPIETKVSPVSQVKPTLFPGLAVDEETEIKGVSGAKEPGHIFSEGDVASELEIMAEDSGDTVLSSFKKVQVNNLLAVGSGPCVPDSTVLRKISFPASVSTGPKVSLKVLVVMPVE